MEPFPNFGAAFTWVRQFKQLGPPFNHDAQNKILGCVEVRYIEIHPVMNNFFVCRALFGPSLDGSWSHWANWRNP